jgi:hypothetical protein
MIAEQEAIKRAKDHLQQEKMSFEGKKIEAMLHRRMFIVDFLPVEGMRGGEYTVLVNANNGEIMSKFIWR